MRARLARLVSTAGLGGGPLDLDACLLAMLGTAQIGARSERSARDVLKPFLSRRQRFDGDACSLNGSVDPVGPREVGGGRVLSTALLVLCDTARMGYQSREASR